MITDKDIASVCIASYDPNAKWDRWWSEADAGGICAGLVSNVLCFRGSVTIEDWLDDLEALAVQDPILGGLHAGFAKGVDQFFTENRNVINNNTIVCGHSLGAARALIMGGYMEQAGIRPRAIITFGSPLPGFLRLAEILQPIQMRAYRNRLDPVTEVPVPIYPDLPYLHPSALISINAIPSIYNDLDPLADHNINLYHQGTPTTEVL